MKPLRRVRREYSSNVREKVTIIYILYYKHTRTFSKIVIFVIDLDRYRKLGIRIYSEKHVVRRTFSNVRNIHA